ncbi:glycosyl hydrolase [uncultured Imperialibacter sp.]|uniref:VPS10 domain-containing protein n=1 Tax=uncultured Imperialibacter sp. TaxID=1672639 RepID=UPI0030DC4C24
MKRLALPLLLVTFAVTALAQRKAQTTQPPKTIDQKYFSEMKYRSVGPSRGGRATAVAGIPQSPYTFYMGSQGGGVWRTDDAGWNWENITDGQFQVGSIGAITVAPSDPNVIYVGTGSACLRGNVSPGIGVYKTMDEGKTWDFIGLPNAGQIGKIVVHPSNPDIAMVAALGNAFGPNPDRGVYKTIDGGKSWKKKLFVSDSTGAIDIEMNPANPRIMYAAMWRADRKPWAMTDGGMEGGIWKSKDMGETWEKLEGGLPTGLLGRIGLAISPAQPDRVWALIQTADESKGGVYRTDDAGGSWKKINRDHELRQRGWYYTHITADPKDANTVYVNNVGFYKSIDGGKTFDTRIRVPHGDNHGLWINPDNTDIMIHCNDGGATVSINGGKSWSHQQNQPTSEFYRVTVDNQFPYRLYAGQQDNTTISVPSYSSGSLTDTEEWFGVGGGESADVAVDPTNPDIIYATSYSGEITFYNKKTGEMRQVTAYPHYTEGTEQRKLKYRWQWNFPVLISKFNTNVIYDGSNYVHKSTNKGQSWEVISPDLTTKFAETLGIPGGPIQHDGTGVEVYSSIFALEESPFNEGELWAGSDDGLVHITRDGGKSWKNITPPGMPAMGTVNKIELSSHQAGRAFVAVYKYRRKDFSPYIFMTNDFGATWSTLTNGKNGIPANHFVRAIAEDPDRKGLLYAGTEFGMYLSFNEGKNWQPFQLNLPVTPITDMEVHEKDLVISTQGRAFWILDDLTPLHQLNDDLMARDAFLYKPRDTYRTNVGGWNGRSADINFFVSKTDDKVTLEIMDARDVTPVVYSSKPDKAKGEKELELKEGMNSLSWNLMYPGPKMADNFMAMVFSANRTPGPKAVPGTYSVKLTAGDYSQTETFELKADPRWPHITTADYQAQFDLASEMTDYITKSQDLIRNMRAIREQAKAIAERSEKAGYSSAIKDKATALNKKLTEAEDAIFQNQIETSQDEINFERKFTNHIARLYGVVIDDHNKPTAGMLERYDDLKKQFIDLRKPYDEVLTTDFPAFNQLLEKENVPRIITEK